jgi:hypothetical protein
MIDRYLRQSILYPNDLALLQRVFDQVCADGHHDPSSLDAQKIATTLLHLFQCGLLDEPRLLAEIRSRQQDFIKRAG